jgi:hypothetical protein
MFIPDWIVRLAWLRVTTFSPDRPDETHALLQRELLRGQARLSSRTGGTIWGGEANMRNTPPRALRQTVARITVGGILCICLLLAGCAWPGSQATSPPPGNIQAGDHQNGDSITLQADQILVVTLASTYWTFAGSSNPQVLASVGAPVVSPAPLNACPVVGSGCGTISQRFRAVGPGTAQVTASRVSCGEALRCVGADGQYQLSVTVPLASH